jgi:hypothetical protein
LAQNFPNFWRYFTGVALRGRLAYGVEFVQSWFYWFILAQIWQSFEIRAIKDVAEMYLNGNKKASLPKHSLPILGDRAKFSREGKVMKRHRTEDVRLPYLL